MSAPVKKDETNHGSQDKPQQLRLGIQGIARAVEGQGYRYQAKVASFPCRECWLTTSDRTERHNSDTQGLWEDSPLPLSVNRWLDERYKDGPFHMLRQEGRGKDAEDRKSQRDYDRKKGGRQPSPTYSVTANARNSTDPDHISKPNRKSATANGVNQKVVIGQTKE